MILIPLPGLSARSGRPAFAQTKAPIGLRRDDDVVPAGALLFTVQDPPGTCMVHIPDALPGAECYDKLNALGRGLADVAWQRFIDRFLAVAIVDPPMTEANVQEALADDRDRLVRGLLRLWNWLPVHDDAECPAPEILRGKHQATRRICPHMPNLPGAPFQDVLKFLAGRLRVAPSDILARYTFSEINLNYRILRGPIKPEPAPPLADDGRPDDDMIEQLEEDAARV